MNTNRLSIWIYGLFLLITLVLFFSLHSWGTDTGQWLISLLALVFVETAAYRLMVYIINLNKQRESIPAYLPFVTLSVLYGAAVIFHIIFFWLVVGVSFSAYFIIHLITLAIWAIGMGIVRYFTSYVQEQEEKTEEQTQFIKQMQASLQISKQNLQASHQPEHELLKREVQQLIENVRYSDPISHASMIVMDENLLWQTNSLEQCVQLLVKNEGDKGNMELSHQLIFDITTDLTKRNSQLKALK